MFRESTPFHGPSTTYFDLQDQLLRLILHGYAPCHFEDCFVACDGNIRSAFSRSIALKLQERNDGRLAKIS
jgi:hypothetical protein